MSRTHDPSPSVRHAVALAIRDAARPGALLLVQRPDDDEDLPGVWGLPATSLAPGEDWIDAAQRAGREKLGVQLDIGDVLNTGSRQRPGYLLSMRLVAARILSGAPDTANAPVAPGSTRYRAWRWGSDDDVRPAAERGSLCSRLLLERQAGSARGVRPAW
jgi:8-oxo-dGTP diphosphatase